jgi:gliding motility-associated-like protein
MRRYLLLLLLTLLTCVNAYATHNVAGDITYKAVNPTTSNCHEYEITVTTYTDMRSSADRCSLTVDFGDGTSALVDRSNLPGESDPNLCISESLNCTGNQGCGIAVGPIYPNFKKNIYRVRHTYAGSYTYIISMKDPNRVANICNILNSVNIQFYLQTELVINDVLGCNESSPLLSTIPLDQACVGHCYYHNPGAYDLDGDSLSYSLSPCLDTNQAPLSVWSSLPLTPGGNLSIDPVTGLMSWCSPPDICNYNICIKVTKWRKWHGHYYEMGYVYRDMQILTGTCNNDNPIIDPLPDLCVLAGTHVSFVVHGHDNITANGLNLSASGDVFNVAPPVATFPTVPGTGLFSTTNNISDAFNWQTTCDHIRNSPHQATFRLQNDDANDPNTPIYLLAYQTVNITVIAPAPAGLTAVPLGQTMLLNWTAEICNPVANGFIQYEIYRRLGCDSNTAGPCVTGVPPPWGYTLIGTTPVGQIGTTTFTDNNNGLGLIPGVTYSYRVVALFTDGAESQPSKNACASLKRDIPVITNVDVDSTSIPHGIIIVRWKNAIPNSGSFTGGLDTVAYPGPYTLKIYSSSGFSLSASAPLLQTFTSASLSTLTDSLKDSIPAIDTWTTPWSYRIDFYGGNPSVLIGSTQKSSSIYLTLTPSDHKLTLSWQENVPWTNYLYAIFKNDPSSATPHTWTQIATTSNQTYADSNLINRHTYCYYVKSFGSYFNASLPDTLVNRSQRNCMAPFDNTPPCPPILQLASDCENFQNTLTWTDPNHSCADDVVTYNIWYSPNQTDPMTVIQQVTVSNDTSFLFSNLTSVAGCYAVTALDTGAVNQSVYSNIVCADNCPFYELPNVFTPNGDNVNDVYNALPYRYIKSVDMKIYDRWGVLLYQTADPHIHWDGKALQSGKLCSDGVYYYICTVNAERLSGIVPYELKGFIQLISSPSTSR